MLRHSPRNRLGLPTGCGALPRSHLSSGARVGLLGCPMCYRFAILVLLASTALGCAKKPPPKSIALASFYRVDYSALSCQQLAEEAALLDDALAVASDQPGSEQPNERVLQIRRATEKVHKTLAAKGCKK